MIYTKEHAEKLQGLLKAEGVKVTLSTLGGKERASLMILIYLDKRETWGKQYHGKFALCQIYGWKSRQ